VNLVRKILKLLAWFVIVILILAVVLLAFIQTPFAKQKIGEVITRVTRTSDGGEVFFGEISGLIPYNIRVGDFRIRDGDGYWLVVKNADVRISLPDLLLFRLKALDVKVASAAMLRLPRGGDKEETELAEKDDTPFTLRSLPSFKVARLRVEEVVVEEPVLGERIMLDLTGEQISTDIDSGASVALLLNRTDGIPGEMKLSAESGPDFSPLSLDLKVNEDTGGELGEMISPEKSGPISIRITGSGPIEEWSTEVSVRAKGLGEIGGNLLIDLTGFLVDGKIEAALKAFPEKEIAGTAIVSIQLETDRGRQNASVSINGNGFQTDRFLADTIKAVIKAEDIYNNPAGTVDLKVSGLTYASDTEAEDPTGHGAGEIIARANLTPAGNNLEGDMEIYINDYSFPGSPIEHTGTRSLVFKAGIKDKKLQASFLTRGEDRIMMKAGIESGINFSLMPLVLNLPGKSSISGSLQSRIDLEILADRLAISRQSIKGLVNADITAKGTVDNPDFRGTIVLEKGHYQNLNSGTDLWALTAEVEANQDRLTIRELSGTTHNDGRIEFSGWLDIAHKEDYPYSGELKLSRAELIDLDLVTAALTGTINLDGTMKAGRVKGDIKINRAQGKIPSAMPESVPQIEVVEINKPGANHPEKPATDSPFLENIALDLKITAPEDIVVTGRGLDSEWKADITVKGTAAKPLLQGGIYLLDGIFIFMGEELELKDCSVTMSGGYPPVPQLKINAEIAKSDIIINLQVVGPVTAPQISLTSQPSYPTDEILAQLLYGRSASQLSGMQALQIANGLRVLQGKGGFLNILTGWTSFLGNIQVDLTEMEGSEEQTAVRVRWSLTRNIYFENQRSIEDKGNVFIARWDLTRRLSLHTQSGFGLFGDSAYLKWKWDY